MKKHSFTINDEKGFITALVPENTEIFSILLQNSKFKFEIVKTLAN